MKTNHTTTARFQTGLIIASATLGLLAVALVFPLRASSAMPGMPSMPASASPPATTSTMPMAGMMNADMGAMMKNMSAMMDKMSGMMATAGKTDAMPMADMAKMRQMMTSMSTMMGAMGGSDQADAAKPMNCACCEKMMSGMDMMSGPKAMAKPAPQPGDGAPASATGDADDHSAHHPAP